MSCSPGQPGLRTTDVGPGAGPGRRRRGCNRLLPTATLKAMNPVNHGSGSSVAWFHRPTRYLSGTSPSSPRRALQRLDSPTLVDVDDRVELGRAPAPGSSGSAIRCPDGRSPAPDAPSAGPRRRAGHARTGAGTLAGTPRGTVPRRCRRASGGRACVRRRLPQSSAAVTVPVQVVKPSRRQLSGYASRTPASDFPRLAHSVARTSPRCELCSQTTNFAGSPRCRPRWFVEGLHHAPVAQVPGGDLPTEDRAVVLRRVLYRAGVLVGEGLLVLGHRPGAEDRDVRRAPRPTRWLTGPHAASRGPPRPWSG